MSNGWTYGLVEDDKGRLRLMEVYRFDDENGYADVDWTDINKENYEMIIKDITYQLEAIYEEDGNIFKWSFKQ